MRFEEWKAKLASHLIGLTGLSPEEERERQYLLVKLRNLRTSTLGPFLADLYLTSLFRSGKIPKELVPDPKQVDEWFGQ